MSEEKKSKADHSEKSNKNKPTNIDPELDVRSDKFNPLKALLSSKTYIPVKNAPIYDNVAKFESMLSKKDSSTQRSAKQTSGPGSSTSTACKSTDEESWSTARNFLPHQGMVKGKGKKARHTRNVLLKMDSEIIEGPLSLMKTWKNDRKRVKIYTRNELTVNGYVTGFIEAFDKHWNIALTDVYEVWKRKKLHFYKTAAHPPLRSESDENASTYNCLERLQQLGIKIPDIKIKSINRKFAECSRCIPQLLIRGEQIVVVTLDT